MKKTIILLLLAFSYLPQTSLAQKLQKPSVDKITGDTILKTNIEMIYSKASWSGTVGEQLRLMEMKVNQDFYLVFGLQTGKTSSFIVPEGAKAFIKLSSNEIITLVNAKDAILSYSTTSYGSQKTLSYAIPKDEFIKLKTAKVTFIRIQAGERVFEYDISEKNANKISLLTELL